MTNRILRADEKAALIYADRLRAEGAEHVRPAGEEKKTTKKK